MFAWLEKEKTPTPAPKELGEREALIRDFHRVRQEMLAVESLYNLTSDFDMIDFYIHELSALDAQGRYLLRTIREKGYQGSLELLPQSEEGMCQKLG